MLLLFFFLMGGHAASTHTDAEDQHNSVQRMAEAAADKWKEHGKAHGRPPHPVSFECKTDPHNLIQCDDNAQSTHHAGMCLAADELRGCKSDGFETYTDLLCTQYPPAFEAFRARWAHPTKANGHTSTISLPCHWRMEISYVLMSQAILEVVRAQTEVLNRPRLAVLPRLLAAFGLGPRPSTKLQPRRFVMCATGVGSGRELAWAARAARDLHLRDPHRYHELDMRFCGVDPSASNFRAAMQLLRANGVDPTSGHRLLRGAGIGVEPGWASKIQQSDSTNVNLGNTLTNGEASKEKHEGDIELVTIQQLSAPFDVVDYWTMDLQGSNTTAVLLSARSVLESKFKTLLISTYAGDDQALEDLMAGWGWHAGFRLPFTPGTSDGAQVYHNPKFVNEAIPKAAHRFRLRDGRPGTAASDRKEGG